LANLQGPVTTLVVPVRFTILGSGSSGNCAYLETDNVRILVDAGLSGRQIRQRLLSIGRSPENLDAILITHEHSDHIQGLKGLAKLRIPIYCNRLTREAIELQAGSASPVKRPSPSNSPQATGGSRHDYRLFTTGNGFELGDLEVSTFSVPHDAYDPVGFHVQTPQGNFAFLTDLGHATKLVLERIRNVKVLVLEANYDVKLLQEDTKRPWPTKQRIMSRHGHLSNDAATEVAIQVATEELQHLYLAHLSSDCNRPELAVKTLSNGLIKSGVPHVAVMAAGQSTPCPTLQL
jgi:phosphoribosyl 1,2-cyclic phosphodiesterase